MSDARSARPAWLRWLPAVLWMGVIFIASSIPGSDIPVGYSSYGHMTEFAILGVLLYLPMRAHLSPAKAALAALAIASAYGVTDELHQFLTPMRTPDPVDWATDTAAAAVAIVIAWSWLNARAKRRARPQA